MIGGIDACAPERCKADESQQRREIISLTLRTCARKNDVYTVYTSAAMANSMPGDPESGSTKGTMRASLPVLAVLTEESWENTP